MPAFHVFSPLASTRTHQTDIGIGTSANPLPFHYCTYRLQFWPASCDLSERFGTRLHQIGPRQNEFFLFFTGKVLPR